MIRDGANESLWQSHMPPFAAARQPSSKTIYDVAIVGAGITGMTTALLLQKSGLQCLLLEAHSLGYGTSSGTTAHLNTLLDTPYYRIRQYFGKDAARLVAEGSAKAIALVEEFISEYNIDCGYGQRQGFFFAVEENQVEDLEKIVAGAQEAGLQMDFINNSVFPIPYLKLAIVEGQAQFHPTRYLYRLAEAFQRAGGVFVQDCRVLDMEQRNSVYLETSKGPALAKKAIYATHIPPGVNLLHFYCAPYRSYAIAVKLEGDDYPQALGYDLHEPYHYYRTQNIDGENFLIAGGEDHKTGHLSNTDQPFRVLESHLRTHFPVASVAHRWSSQYYESADGLPFIGHLPGGSENMFVATGFSGNGMTLGTLSAILFRDILTGKDTPYEDLFKPTRVKPIAGFSSIIKETADVVKSFFAGRLSVESLTGLADIAPGEGRVLRVGHHPLAIYKDEKGVVHAVNPICTHFKCTVSWNGTEKSWDCPCHGARFSVDGKVLTGPAHKDLQKVDIEQRLAKHR